MFLTSYFMNLLVPRFLYKTTTGQVKNSKAEQDKTARQKITRKHGKFIDKKDLHDKMIGVHLKKK